MTRLEYDYLVFEWDDNKDATNQAKHGISFSVAHRVFFDENQLTELYQIVGGEERFKTLGMIDNFVVLFLGYAVYDDELGHEVIRIITARKATTHESKEYYDNC